MTKTTERYVPAGSVEPTDGQSPMHGISGRTRGSGKLYKKPRILLGATDMERMALLKEEAEVFDVVLKCEIIAPERRAEKRFDIFIADVSGMGEEAFSLVEMHRLENRNSAIILITDSDDVEFYKRVMKLGVFDCFSRPYRGKDLQLSISELIKKRRDKTIAAIKSSYEEELLKDREQIGYIMSMVESLVLALEARDRYTRGHSERVTELVAELAGFLGMEDSAIERLKHASRLHDIGKIGIKDSILHKPEALTLKERDMMKHHPVMGEEILQPVGYFSRIIPAIKHHHERFDGGGYPSALAGSDIPVEARIIALADAYDAMRSDRPYRKGMDKSATLAEIEKGRGGQFDPFIADAFIKVINKSRRLDELYRFREEGGD